MTKTETTTYEVVALGAAYFTDRVSVDGNGDPLRDRSGKEIVARVRRNASRGDLIELSPGEESRLVGLGVVCEPGKAPLRGGPVTTLFSVPAGDGGTVDLGDEVDQPGIVNPGTPGAAIDTAAATAELDKALADEDELDLDEAPIEDITTWINEEKITVDQLVEASAGDPLTAGRLIEAEKGGAGRKTAIERLEVIAKEDEA